MKKVEAQAQGVKIPAELEKKKLDTTKSAIGVEREKVELQTDKVALENEKMKGADYVYDRKTGRLNANSKE